MRVKTPRIELGSRKRTEIRGVNRDGGGRQRQIIATKVDIRHCIVLHRTNKQAQVRETAENDALSNKTTTQQTHLTCALIGQAMLLAGCEETECIVVRSCACIAQSIRKIRTQDKFRAAHC